jgi:hypothetical protein
MSDLNQNLTYRRTSISGTKISTDNLPAYTHFSAEGCQIAWKIVPLRHFFPLKVVPLIEVLLYSGFWAIARYCKGNTLRLREAKIKIWFSLLGSKSLPPFMQTLSKNPYVRLNQILHLYRSPPSRFSSARQQKLLFLGPITKPGGESGLERFISPKLSTALPGKIPFSNSSSDFNEIHKCARPQAKHHRGR